MMDSKLAHLESFLRTYLTAGVYIGKVSRVDLVGTAEFRVRDPRCHWIVDAGLARNHIRQSVARQNGPLGVDGSIENRQDDEEDDALRIEKQRPLIIVMRITSGLSAGIITQDDEMMMI